MPSRCGRPPAAIGVSLLEPIDEVAVLIPDDLVGAVMGDLSGRRGRVLGTEPVGDDRTFVRAEVPQLEIARYAIDLRCDRATAPRTFTRTFARYEPMPDNIAAKFKTSELSVRARGLGGVQRQRGARSGRWASQWSTSAS